MKRIAYILSLLLILPTVLSAAEVINLKVGQSGDKGFATYDLAGKIGEREAEVSVVLTINGEKFTADRLTLSGDLGKKVRTGAGKRIVWDILADIPLGFDGEVIWDVTAPGGSAPVAVKGPPQPAKPVAPAAIEIPKPVPPAAAGLSASAQSTQFVFNDLIGRDKDTGLLWLREVMKDGNGLNWNKARTAIRRLAEDKFAGCADWRLPWEEEMQRLYSYATEAGYTGRKGKGYPADFFNSIGFSGVVNDYYWTQSVDITYGGGHAARMAVDLEAGGSVRKPVDKSYLQFWPVCKPD